MDLRVVEISNSGHVCHSSQCSASPVHVSDLLFQPGNILDRKSYHLHTWRLSCSTSKQQDFQSMSLGSQLLLEDPQQIARTMTGGFALLKYWAAEQGIDLLGPTAAQIVTFLFSLFKTHGLCLKQSRLQILLSPYAGLRSTGRTGNISDTISSME